jgi:4-aminobutyrate aminotransferase-like enzyme
VRGMGLMQGMELVSTDGKKTPDKNRANALLNAARKRGFLIGKGGLYGNVIRISPHLNVSSEDMAAGCELLGKALADVA